MSELRGINAGGHMGWITKRCAICYRRLIVNKETIYYCPKCSEKIQAYFCEGDAKVLHGKCPYCRSDLVALL